jgi:hypothetical protein
LPKPKIYMRVLDSFITLYIVTNLISRYKLLSWK